jgi:hypothetical protein
MGGQLNCGISFSGLARRLLRHGEFTSRQDPIDQIRDFTLTCENESHLALDRVGAALQWDVVLRVPRVRGTVAVSSAYRWHDVPSP